MIRRLIILLLIVGCVFGEDEYPYFSDANKQLEFEKKKISIGLLSGNISIDGKKIEIDEFFGMIGLVEDEKKTKEMREKAISDYELNYDIYKKDLEKYYIKNEEGMVRYKLDSIRYEHNFKSIEDSLKIIQFLLLVQIYRSF